MVRAVDQFGVSLTAYELECAIDADAERRASTYLRIHPAVEVWQGIRRVARLTREQSGRPSKGPQLAPAGFLSLGRE